MVSTMWNKTCRLGMYEYHNNEIGEPEKAIEFSDVELYCNQKSVRASEFYQANTTGYKPEITLEVNVVDYEEFTDDDEVLTVFVMYKQRIYTVIRTYQSTAEKIELVLQRGVLDANAEERC